MKKVMKNLLGFHQVRQNWELLTGAYSNGNMQF